MIMLNVLPELAPMPNIRELCCTNEGYYAFRSNFIHNLIIS